MDRRQQLTTRLKAEAFDRIVARYGELEDDDGFYSRNWVELAEVIEQELKRIRWIADGGERG